MTVRGLNFLMNSIPNASRNIKDLKKEFEAIKKASSDNPIIVINVSCLIAAFIRFAPEEHICGGRGQQFLNRVESFLKFLKDCGAELVFFTDYTSNLAIKKNRENDWIAKHTKRHKAHEDIYKKIIQGATLEKLAANNFSHFNIIHYELMKIVMEKFKTENPSNIFVTSEHEREIEIGKFVKTYDVYAVLADKSDTIIFDGVERLWLLKSLSFMTNDGFWMIKEWNQRVLLKYLNFDQLKAPGALELWATMLGNDYTSEKIPNARGQFNNIADFIKSGLERGSTVEELIENEVGTFLNINSEATKGKFFKSMEFYLPNAEIDDKESKKVDQYLGYSMLEGYTIGIPESMENRQDVSLTLIADIFAPSFARLAGIFMKGKGITDGDAFINVIHYDESENYKLHKILAVYPDFYVPSPEMIVFSSNNEKIFRNRIKLLNFIFEMQWDETHFDHLPEDVSFNLTLDLMEMKMGCDVDEKNLFLLTWDDSRKGRIPDKIEFPEYLDRRALAIVHKFLNLYHLMNIILISIGLEKFTKTIPFDAVHFHNLFEKLL